jgi:hypothetical protein
MTVFRDVAPFLILQKLTDVSDMLTASVIRVVRQ